mgnify:CR=1 FL=1
MSVSEVVDLAGQRRFCRALMGREILFFALLHDIRGSLTSLMGWHSMLEGEANPSWSGLGRSIEGLRMSSVGFAGTSGTVDELSLVDLGVMLRTFSSSCESKWEVIGDAHVYIDDTRLLCALELASPSRIEISNDDGRVILHLMGLPRRGVECLESQTSKELIALAGIEGRDWGVVLLKETVRNVRGSTISVIGPNSVTVSLNGEA